MDKLTEIIGLELAYSKRAETGSYEAERTSYPGLVRIDKKDLELAYMLDPIVFNGVNQIVNAFLSVDFRLTGVDEKTKNFFDEFNKQIEFKEYLLPTIVSHSCIYGIFFGELVRNKRGNKIVDVEPIDPKTMDYQKTIGGQVKVDEKGLVVGYKQKSKNPISSKYEVDFKREQIAQIGMFFVGDGFYPIGLIEPCYKTTVRKLNIEEGLAQAAYRHGFPIFVARVGDSSHEPTPEDVSNIMNKLKNMSYKSEMAVPYYYDIQIKEPSQMETYADPLNYFINQQIASLGIPKTVVTGSEERSNRAVLSVQNYIFQRRIEWMQRHLGNQISQQIYARVADAEGFEAYPQIEFAPLDFESLNAKVERFKGYQELGFIQPGDSQIKKIFWRLEQIPEEATKVEEDVPIK